MEETWSEFKERLDAQLEDLRRRGVKYHVHIIGGRHHKETGADLPPVFNVQVYDPQR